MGAQLHMSNLRLVYGLLMTNHHSGGSTNMCRLIGDLSNLIFKDAQTYLCPTSVNNCTVHTERSLAWVAQCVGWDEIETVYLRGPKQLSNSQTTTMEDQ